MEIAFRDSKLGRLETDISYSGGYDLAIVRAFRKVINFLRDARDERDLYSYKSLRFEKLKGDRSHQRSLRLSDQFRLIVEIRVAKPKNTLVVISIEDYH